MNRVILPYFRSRNNAKQEIQAIKFKDIDYIYFEPKSSYKGYGLLTRTIWNLHYFGICHVAFSYQKNFRAASATFQMASSLSALTLQNTKRLN